MSNNWAEISIFLVALICMGVVLYEIVEIIRM